MLTISTSLALFYAALECFRPDTTYYHGTIGGACADDKMVQSQWYDPPFPDRTRTGFYFTSTGGCDRWATSSEQIQSFSGLHYIILTKGALNNRAPVSYMSHDWSNATLKPLANYNVKVGESVDFTYYYQNAGGNRGTIEFFLDKDTYPLNDNIYRQIGTPSVTERTSDIGTEVFPWQPTDADAQAAKNNGGGLYVQIKATNPSGNVRHDYLLKPIYIRPAAQLPSDLVVENLSITPGSGEPGSTATVSFGIRNNGDIAYPSHTNIRLSAYSSNVTVNDTLLASIEIPQIAKGATYQVSQNVVIPGVGTSGTYHVWVILDVNNEANQGSNTSNDKAHQPFAITVPSPPTAIGDFVQVYNTGNSGLRVRSPNACDSPLIGQNRFDGVVGKVIDGPQTCNINNVNYTMWKVQWDDCIVGWSAQDWMKKIPSANISCSATYAIIRLEGDLNFGAVQVGGSVQRTMTIYNDGNSTLTVSSISYLPGFSGNWSGTIGAGSSKQVTVTFSPTEQKTYSGNVTVTSNATSGTNTRPVSGSGTITSHTVTATINSISPNYATQGTTVNFSGTGSDSSGHLITAYNWHSSLEGTIGTFGSFGKSDLKEGSHYIYFRVQCSIGTWSSEMPWSGNPLVITPNCTYDLINGTNAYFNSGGGSGKVDVTTSSSNCSWTAASNANWITITSGSSGTGNGTVSYSVSDYTGTDTRTGTMTIAKQTFTVIQEGPAPCKYSISPTSQSFSSNGGSGKVGVTTSSSSCSWTAKSNANWITITNVSYDVHGDGTVSYTVSAYTGTDTRTGTMTIAEKTFTIIQSPPPVETVITTIGVGHQPYGVGVNPETNLK